MLETFCLSVTENMVKVSCLFTENVLTAVHGSRHGDGRADRNAWQPPDEDQRQRGAADHKSHRLEAGPLEGGKDAKSHVIWILHLRPTNLEFVTL